MKDKHHLLLTVLLSVFILFDIKVPLVLAELVDNPIGKIITAVLALCLLSVNALAGVVGLVAAYVLIQRAGDATGTTAEKIYVPDEKKKSSQLSKRKAKIFFKNNIKENKEHNMIVDMERNDLSKICKSGTVKISKLKYVEEYKDLYHYVSKISGKLKENIKTIDILKAMMPGGSVIGCPKINTLHLLNHLEKDSRNIFTGSFGYIKSNRDMRFNIIIRSLLNYKGINEISVASGIILGSRAKKEYEENHIKAKSLLDIFKV